MKKKIIICVSLLILFFVIGILILIIGARPVNKKDNTEVIFTIDRGESKTSVINRLADKDNNLIRSKFSAYTYIILHGNMSLQSGTYSLNRTMSTGKILKKFHDGEIVDTRKTATLKFIEGQRLSEYADTIAKFINENNEGSKITKDDVLKEISDTEYVKGLIKDYWFLTDEVLDPEIYYPLEGYLHPNTYEFYTTATAKDIVKRMLDATSNRLEEYKDEITASGHTVHEILSAAAIIEKEANSTEDRKKVSQVIYKRLEKGMSLGMDVTAYYAAKADLKDDYMYAWNNLPSKYNTRNINNIGLPIGPICNPSISSIKAALEPSNTNYLYFYADMKTGKVYFAEDYNGFIEIQRNLGVK
ncbi:MAG: endolytic transglycosylase MltG [Bacilli bacterium]|nr:endolytic transglycosylase MltG [Bacilli bacterium]